jgi:hypothetical protein
MGQGLLPVAASLAGVPGRLAGPAEPVVGAGPLPPVTGPAGEPQGGGMLGPGRLGLRPELRGACPAALSE